MKWTPYKYVVKIWKLKVATSMTNTEAYKPQDCLIAYNTNMK